jgi:hydrogenase-4 component F
LILGVITIVGLPPTGIFLSEFLILTSTFARAPVLAVVLGLGLLIALGALLYRLNGLAFGEPVGSNAPTRASYVPLFTHLALVLAAGIFLPPLLVSWFQHVAELLG